MKIGICSPVTLNEFHRYLPQSEISKIKNLSGLFAPAVDAVVHEFVRLGHHVVIFTLDKNIDFPIVVHGKGITIHIGRYRKSARSRGLTFFAQEIFDLKKGICSEKLDVIHAHWTYEFAIAVLYAQCPRFCTIRDVSSMIFRLNRTIYRGVRWCLNYYLFAHRKDFYFIANSSYTKGEIERRYPDLCLPILPNPVKISERCISVKKSQFPSIISVSNGWTSLKNITTLILAFRLVRKIIPEAELHLVGAVFTSDATEARKLTTKESGVLDGVFLDGYVPHEKLSDEIAKAWIMVHPSLEESFGNTLIEAMAVGVPVVGGRNSGAVPWVLDYGRAGILCDVSSPESMAEVIISLLSDAKMRDKFTRAGTTSVSERFSIESVARRTLSLYEKVLKSYSDENKSLASL